jgi:uncharacterized lipoprotein
MKTVKYFGLAAVLVLVGCANKDSYMEQAQQTAALNMPEKVALQKAEPYYQVPYQVNTKIERPSLIPPGSNLEQSATQAKQKQSVAAAKKLATLGHSKGAPVLAMAENQQRAWGRVGDALRATEYQILDQDASMSSYYILDTSTTGKKITEETPIYRVFVKNSKKNASMVMLLSEQNEKVDARVTNRILGTLAEQLA